MSDAPYKRAIIILADGARPDVLNEEMAKGNLPNMADYFAAKGTNKSMLTCFPSTTGPAYLPYVTGCFPGTCNVPGIRWFDKPHYAKSGWGFKSFRSYCGPETMFLDSDMNPKIKTAWEVFPQSKSIFNGVTKGIKKGHDLTSGGRIWHYYYAHMTDRWSYIDRVASHTMTKMIASKDFDFAFVVFPSVDEYSHRSSVFHDRVRKAYQEIDSYIGKMREDLRRVGLEEETLVFVVADHGLSDTHSHFDVGPWLEQEKGLRTFYYTNIAKFKFDAASMVSGNGMVHLYFKGQEGWKGRKCFEEISHESLLLDELRIHPAVALVATQGANSAIHVQTEKGHGSFRYDLARDQILYEFDRDDPLGIFKGGEAVLSNGFSMRESLASFYDSYFPDVFCQLFLAIVSIASYWRYCAVGLRVPVATFVLEF
ncbi:MAG: alkaline phosphatase family protein [Deltaproteobacteria bacterium]|nr:alkaline phosphatase family protein [Deltaproteobacteria bacterium]